MSTSQITVIAILVVGFFIIRHMYKKLPSCSDKDQSGLFMDTKLEQIKREMLELVSKELDTDSPETIDWMERAANIVRKDQLQEGQIWKYDGKTGLTKVWVN